MNLRFDIKQHFPKVLVFCLLFILVCLSFALLEYMVLRQESISNQISLLNRQKTLVEKINSLQVHILEPPSLNTGKIKAKNLEHTLSKLRANQKVHIKSFELYRILILIVNSIAFLLVGYFLFKPILNRIKRKLGKPKEAAQKKIKLQEKNQSKDSEELYRTLFVHSKDAMMTVAPPDWKFTSCNDAALKMFVIKDEAEFCSYSPLELSPEFQADGMLSKVKFKKTIEIVMKQGSSFFEYVHRRIDGKNFPSTVLLTRMELHGQYFLLATVRDISQDKVAMKSIARFNQLIERSLNEIYIFSSATLQFIDVNLGARKNLGYSIDELRNFTPLDIKPEFTKVSFEEKITILRSGEIEKIQFETIHRRKNGTCYPVEIHLQLIDEDPPVFIAIILDITKRKKAEETLRRAEKMEAIGQLTGGIAHDFNNILSIILGNVHLLQNEISNNEATQKKVATIKKSAERAANLTTQLLDFSRRKTKEITATNINHTIKEMDALISHSLTPHIQVTPILDKNLEKVLIDSGDFQDAILNLVINARDAMNGRGKLTIETKNSELDEAYCALNPNMKPGEYVLLMISDNGKGMSTEAKERIFEPFYTTKPQGKGTGMGLAMVFGFIKRSQGHIQVYSEPQMGTTFRIYLPKALTKNANDKKIKKQDKKQRQGHETILVVDDEVDMIELAKESLQELGYKVLAANSASQALKKLSKHSDIELMFSDVVMPGDMNGYELAQKATELYPKLKVLLTSGYTQNITLQKKQTHFNATLLSKPYTQNEMTRKIAGVLGKPEHSKKSTARVAQMLWNESMSVGIDTLDEDHKYLYQLLNDCQKYIDADNKKQIHIVLERLESYFKEHFEREEIAMRVCNYPDLHNHTEIHILLIKQIAKMKKRFERDKIDGDDLIIFFQEWLIDHIKGLDQSFTSFCKGQSETIHKALEKNKSGLDDSK